MENKQLEILKKLSNYRVTESYHKFNFGYNVLTDGMREFAILCKCSWLITDIDAYFITNKNNIANGDNRFWVARIEVDEDKKAVMTIREDDGIKPIITQKYSYTDFPLKEYEFFIIKQQIDEEKSIWVYLLKGEY